MAVILIEPDELDKLIRRAVKDAIEQNSDSDNCREWYTLQAACQKKGLCYNSAKSRRALQPNAGAPDAMLSGRKVWNRKTIQRWLSQTDTASR